MTSANIVGYQTINSPEPGKYIALGVQFEGVSSATIPVKDLVTNSDPKGAKSCGSGDMLWRWDPNLNGVGGWVKYFYSSSSKAWCDEAKNVLTETTTVSNGDTLFFYRASAATGVSTLTLAGGVSPLGGTPKVTGLEPGKYRFVCYPWPVDMKIANFLSYQKDPKGAKSVGSGDMIWYWSSTKGGTGDWDKYFYSSSSKNWCDASKNPVTNQVIPAGEGFFFYRASAATSNEELTFTLN